jgi:hypothetical protein
VVERGLSVGAWELRAWELRAWELRAWELRAWERRTGRRSVPECEGGMVQNQAVLRIKRFFGGEVIPIVIEDIVSTEVEKSPRVR